MGFFGPGEVGVRREQRPARAFACPGSALVKIAPAAGEDALLAALSEETGTAFVAEDAWTSTS